MKAERPVRKYQLNSAEPQQPKIQGPRKPIFCCWIEEETQARQSSRKRATDPRRQTTALHIEQQR
jgi:hypothetical protein